MKMKSSATFQGHTNSVVATFKTHPQAEETVKQLQHSGFHMKLLSIVGKGYPSSIGDGSAHVDAVAHALSTFAYESRNTIMEADELEDAVTADLFTEVTRGIDKWLWFVEAHHQASK